MDIMTNIACGMYYIDTRWIEMDGKFETMVFYCDDKGNVLDWVHPTECRRYFTKEEAIKGHNDIYKKYASLIK